MLGETSQGHFERQCVDTGYNIRKCVDMLIMIMVQCRAFTETQGERIEIMPSRGRAECHELPAATFLSAVTVPP